MTNFVVSRKEIAGSLFFFICKVFLLQVRNFALSAFSSMWKNVFDPGCCFHALFLFLQMSSK